MTKFYVDAFTSARARQRCSVHQSARGNGVQRAEAHYLRKKKIEDGACDPPNQLSCSILSLELCRFSLEA